MNCPKCGSPVYYTGEHHPTVTPQRYYACENKHVVLVYDQEDEDVDWGDKSITRAWREALKDRGRSINDYELVGKVHWKSLD